MALALCAGLLAGCASDEGLSMPRLQDLNPFAEKEVPLPGKRVAVLAQDQKAGELATEAGCTGWPKGAAMEAAKARFGMEAVGRQLEEFYEEVIA